VPLGGFGQLQGVSGAQKFSIHLGHGGSDRLPTAHTCFNQLDLQRYDSKESLKERLMLAIHEGGGFGFA
jgi:E3 ubiquitin-protein ligase HUWE1